MDFGVRKDKQEALIKRMKELEIFEEDLEEKFIRASGKGGQKVNKTSSSVYLKHVPSGIEVKVDREREQSINRFLARRALVEKYEVKVLGKKPQSALAAEKKRKQKSRRQRRTKAKLAQKKSSEMIDQEKE